MGRPPSKTGANPPPARRSAITGTIWKTLLDNHSSCNPDHRIVAIYTLIA
jgi:hypothetical protein